MSDTPASRVVSLQSPVETASWVILKEGFLTKSKLAKGLLPSSKLRYFVLKQDSATLEARLEYYEGMLFRGSCALDCAAVKPASKPGTFSIVTRKRGGDRTITLQADAAHVEDATKWVIAIKQAALAKVKTAAERASQVVPDVAGVVHSGATRHRHASGEIDGVAIDNARWAALMKRQQQTQEEEVCLRCLCCIFIARR